MDYAKITASGTRDYNEDAALISAQGGRSLFVVADGLGGHGRGEVASALAIESFCSVFESEEETDSLLPRAFEAAQARIMREQAEQNASAEMKTTCAAVALEGDVARVGHVGDTRVYAFERGRLKWRTLDHSVPQLLVLSGEIKERQIRRHPDRNRLLRVLGIPWDEPKYELSDEIPLKSGMAFLLCTDGFWEFCEEKTMAKLLKKCTSAEDWLEKLAREVERQGAGEDMDNYTAIAVIL